MRWSIEENENTLWLLPTIVIHFGRKDFDVEAFYLFWSVHVSFSLE